MTESATATAIEAVDCDDNEEAVRTIDQLLAVAGAFNRLLGTLTDE